MDKISISLLPSRGTNTAVHPGDQVQFLGSSFGTIDIQMRDWSLSYHFEGYERRLTLKILKFSFVRSLKSTLLSALK